MFTEDDILEVDEAKGAEYSQLEDSADQPLRVSTAVDLKQLSTYFDSIKTIADKGPLQDRALKCYNIIQSICLPCKTKLKEAEGKAKQRRQGFFKLQRTSSQVPLTVKMSPPNPSYSTDCLHISGEVDLLPIFME